ncbi:MAG: CDP-diacylglycerol--glycerol-3-phosphate 3-phosphatidyltransferase [Bryobacterales bacterium]|nr:CDP-diacylglycerol--glycerol-3-phosphate 3-phosphatidyltransferase [Bryobacterales bacterium]
MLAASLFALAAFTDFLDGQLARVWRATTPVGQYLDPIADKVLLNSVFVALGIHGSISIWYLALVLGRDLAILVASAIAMRVSKYDDYTPSVWGKISTMLQVLTAVVLMGGNALPFPHFHEAARSIVIASGVATAWSAVHYTWRGVSFFLRR